MLEPKQAWPAFLSKSRGSEVQYVTPYRGVIKICGMKRYWLLRTPKLLLRESVENDAARYLQN